MRKDVEFHYDREADVLYLSLGKPQNAKTTGIGEDFVLRLHPKSGQVVGITIINFSKHFPCFLFKWQGISDILKRIITAVDDGSPDKTDRINAVSISFFNNFETTLPKQICFPNR